VLQCAVVCCSVLQDGAQVAIMAMRRCAAVCCSVLQCMAYVALCCSGLQAMHSDVFMCMACDTYQMSHATHVKISRHSRDWIMSHI